MTPEPTDALVERVRLGIVFDMPGPDHGAEDALAALTELAERLKAAELRCEEEAQYSTRLQMERDEWRGRAEVTRDHARGDLLERLKAAERDDGEWAAMGLALTAAEAQRDELVEALERIAVYGDASSRQSGEKDIARAALAKHRDPSCICTPGEGWGWEGRVESLRGPYHRRDCPMFSTGQEAAGPDPYGPIGHPTC